MEVRFFLLLSMHSYRGEAFGLGTMPGGHWVPVPDEDELDEDGFPAGLGAAPGVFEGVAVLDGFDDAFELGELELAVELSAVVSAAVELFTVPAATHGAPVGLFCCVGEADGVAGDDPGVLCWVVPDCVVLCGPAACVVMGVGGPMTDAGICDGIPLFGVAGALGDVAGAAVVVCAGGGGGGVAAGRACAISQLAQDKNTNSSVCRIFMNPPRMNPRVARV